MVKTQSVMESWNTLTKGEGDAAYSHLSVTICIDPQNVSHLF